jgi:Kinesin motor domain
MAGEVLTRLSTNSEKEYKICQQRMMESHGSISNFFDFDDKKTAFPFSDTIEKLKLTASRSDFGGLKSPTNSHKRDSAAGSLSGHSVSDSMATSRMLHVPYMDSKLTFLLRDSLGGNCRTVMITTIDPNIESYSQNLSFLNLAMKAGKVLNRPTANRMKTVEKVTESPSYKEQITIPRACSAVNVSQPTEFFSEGLPEPTTGDAMYSITLDNLQVMDLEAGKRSKVFPIYSYVKVGIAQQQFQTVRWGYLFRTLFSTDLYLHI